MDTNIESVFAEKFITEDFVTTEILNLLDIESHHKFLVDGNITDIITALSLIIWSQEAWSFFSKRKIRNINFNLLKSEIARKIREHAIEYYNKTQHEC